MADLLGPLSGMSAQPRISIVIPNLNSGPVLERAIRSILDQGYPNCQIIMADAGSTDESRQIIEDFRDRIDVLTSGLRDRGCEVAASQANFVYASFGDATLVNEGLLERGIIVRPVYPDGWLRINTGTPTEMERFLGALDEMGVNQ